MAKPTTYATPICIILSILAIIGIILGFVEKNALWIILFLIPAVGYEAYRTEGVSTKFASWALLVLLIAEIICLVFGIKFDLAGYLNQDYTYVGGTSLPLGELVVVFPMIMAALSVLLFIRTVGIYTKWLAVIIFVSMIATVYLISPTGFRDLMKSIIQSLFWYL